MKGYLLILLIAGAMLSQVQSQAATKTETDYNSTDDSSPWYVPEHHKDDLHVKLGTYHAGNTTVGKELADEIHEKQELVKQGEVHNNNLKTVHGYVSAWQEDIAQTKDAVEKFENAASNTRDQWSDVKETQVTKKLERVVPAHPKVNTKVKVVANGAKKSGEKPKNFKFNLKGKMGPAGVKIVKKGKGSKAKKVSKAKKPAAAKPPAPKAKKPAAAKPPAPKAKKPAAAKPPAVKVKKPAASKPPAPKAKKSAAVKVA